MLENVVCKQAHYEADLDSVHVFLEESGMWIM